MQNIWPCTLGIHWAWLEQGRPVCSVREEKAKGERAQKEEIGPFFLRAHNNQRSISVHSETENKLEVDWLPVVSVCWPIWPRILLVNLTRLYQGLSTCVELISVQLNNKDL